MSVRTCVQTPFRKGFGVESGYNKSDPARCVNTMCAGPRRTGLEFD